MPTASNVKAERFWPAVPEHIWDSIREEFTLPAAADLEDHFLSLGDPEAMRRAVRVFIGEDTFCPGFQLKEGLFHEPVLCLFDQAMSLKIPHNVFAAWMVSPSGDTSPPDRIRAHLDALAVTFGSEGPLDSLFTKATIELADRDPEVAVATLGAYRRLEDEYATCIQQAQESSEVDKTVDARELATYYVAVTRGKEVLGSAGVSQNVLQGIGQTAFSLLT